MGGGNFEVALDDAFWRSLCRVLASSIEGSVSCIDRRRRVLYLSPSSKHSRTAALGKRAEELLPAEERAAAIECIERAFSSHQPQRLEHEALSAEGQRQRRSTRVVPFRGPRGEDLAVQLTTERAAPHHTAREPGQELQRQVLQHLPDFVMVLDAEHRFVWLNRAVLGLAPADLVGKTLDAFVTPEGASKTHAAIDAAFRSGESQSFEVEGPGAGGSSAWYAVRAVPMGDNGAIEHVLLSTMDISERRRAAQALHEKEEQLHRAQHLESLGQLAGGIAHDFNNLLQVIEGNLSFVKEGLRRGELPLEDVDQALRATERAGELTSRLLAVGRRSRVAPQRVELGALVEQGMRMLRRVIPENIELRYERPASPFFVAVDPSSFEQVLINVCVNARDAMPEGGAVQLRVAADGREHVVVCVSDTGSGIPPQHLSRIFEPFFTTKGAGSGLGLAVAAGIMAAHGGDIKAHSDGHNGTTIELRLPRSLDPAAENPPPSELNLRGSGLILVAEDEDLVRAQVVRMLSRAGYTILQASNGADAVAIFEQHADAIDLVLLDVVMPELDGWRAYQRMLELRPSVKVLFTTGYAANVLPPDFAARGARLLSKPYKRQDLLGEVRDLLSPNPTP